MQISKYKVGDSVKVLNKGFLAGKTGTVVACNHPDYVGMIGVDFGVDFGNELSFPLTHTLNGLLKDRTGKWIASDNLEKVNGGLVVELLWGAIDGKNSL